MPAETTISISEITGFIGGLAGVLALTWQILTYLKNRKPKLKLHIPYRAYGTSSETEDTHFLIMLIKIANLRSAPCFVFWETINVYLDYGDKWNHVSVQQLLPGQQLIFEDLPVREEYMTGNQNIHNFNIHDATPIKDDNPYIRVMALTHCNRNDLENATNIMIQCRDSYGRKYKLQAPLRK